VVLVELVLEMLTVPKAFVCVLQIVQEKLVVMMDVDVLVELVHQDHIVTSQHQLVYKEYVLPVVKESTVDMMDVVVLAEAVPQEPNVLYREFVKLEFVFLTVQSNVVEMMVVEVLVVSVLMVFIVLVAVVFVFLHVLAKIVEMMVVEVLVDPALAIPLVFLESVNWIVEITNVKPTKERISKLVHKIVPSVGMESVQSLLKHHPIVQMIVPIFVETGFVVQQNLSSNVLKIVRESLTSIITLLVLSVQL